MKIFGINFETRKDLRNKIARLEYELEAANKINDQVIGYNEEIGVKLEDMMETFPLELGSIVYDLQLRGDNGRFTRKKASKEHSLINEVVVDRRNYFRLVARLDYDVFRTREAAEKYLNEICIK